MLIRKRILSSMLIFVLAVSAFLCIYSLLNYKVNSTVNGNTFQNNFFTRGRNPGNENNNSIQNSQSDIRNNQPGDFKNRQPGGFQNRADTNLQNSQQPDFNRSFSGRNFNQSSQNTYDSQESIALVVYSAVFLAAFIVVFRLFRRKKVSLNLPNITLIIVALVGIGLLLRIAAATLMTGHPFDIMTFKNWASAAANNLTDVYTSGRTSDYPPFYMYILFVIGKLAAIPSMNQYCYLLLKLPSMLADIVTACLIFRLARKYVSDNVSILLAAFYIFNPAVLINSTFWGQVDSFFTLLVILSVCMLTQKRMILSAVFITAAILMKPQGIIFLPVLFFEILRQKKISTFMKALIPAVITGGVLILPFALNRGITWIFSLFAGTIGEYKYASVNAFNFFGFLGANYKDDSAQLFIFSYRIWGIIFIVAVTLFSWFIYVKGRDSKYAPAAALILISGVFIFSSRMHERYLFPVVALAVVAYIYLKDKRFILLTGGFSITVFVNTYYVLFNNSNGIKHYDPVLMITAFVNIMLFGYLAKTVYELISNKTGIGGLETVDNFIE